MEALSNGTFVLQQEKKHIGDYSTVVVQDISFLQFEFIFNMMSRL